MCENCVFRRFLSLIKTSGTRLCNFTKNKFLQIYFSRILTRNFHWQLSEQLFIRTSFFRNISVAASKLCLVQLDYSLYCVFNFPSVVQSCLPPSSSSTSILNITKKCQVYATKTDILQEGSFLLQINQTEIPHTHIQTHTHKKRNNFCVISTAQYFISSFCNQFAARQLIRESEAKLLLF